MLGPMSPQDKPVACLDLPLEDAEWSALYEFTSGLSERFGARVSELCLFGSRARGEGHEESDLDVLVAIDELTPTNGARWLGDRAMR